MSLYSLFETQFQTIFIVKSSPGKSKSKKVNMLA